MPFPLSLSQSDYETLVALARRGTYNPDGSVNQNVSAELETWLRDLERRNGVQRYFLLVQWQELGSVLPAGTKFPEVWPPSLRAQITLTTRPSCAQDVQDLLRNRARRPVEVLVTTDPAGILGWTKLEDYFR